MSLAAIAKILEQSNEDLISVFNVVDDIEQRLTSYLSIKREQGVLDKKNFEFQQAQLNSSNALLRAFRESQRPTGDDLERNREQNQFNERLLKAVQASGGKSEKSVTKNYKGNSFGGSVGGALAGGIALGGKGIGAAVALGSLGLGLGGFFAGLAAGDKLASMANTDFGSVKTGMKSLGEAIAETPAKGLMGIAALMGVGAKFGSLKGAIGMSFLGMGIGGFFSGLALGDKAGDMMNVDGSGLKTQMKNFAEGISAFDDKTLVALAGVMAMGAVMGTSAVSAAAGMTAVGAGIGGFFTAIAGIGDLGAAAGIDGTGIRDMMTNIAGGLEKLAQLNYGNLLGLIPAVLGLGPAMLVLLGSKGLSSIGDAITGFFGGGDSEDDIFSKVAKGLQKLEVLDVNKLSGLTAVANSVKNLTDGLSALSDIDFDDVRDQLDELGKTLTWAGPMLSAIDTSGIQGTSSVFDTIRQNVENQQQAMAMRANQGTRLSQETKQMDENKNKSTPIIVSAPTQNTNNVNTSSTSVMGNSSMSMTDAFDSGTRDW
ncbi:MAG: hypothetical protein ACSHXL_06665 [Bacteroidota bacterium]